VPLVQTTRPKYIQWDDINSVGHELLDRQHQELVGLINDLYDMVSELSAADSLVRVCQTLDEVVRYTTVHFQLEEDILVRVEYPKLYQHRLAHHRMREKTLRLQQRFTPAPTRSAAFEVLWFLRKWWTAHINRIDATYSAHIDADAGFGSEAPTLARPRR
jgi:hemerythrin